MRQSCASLAAARVERETLPRKTHVIELALNCTQAGFDVAETLSKGQLGKSKTKELIETRKSAEFIIAAVALDALVELVRWEVIDQLGEDCAADRHAPLSGRAAGWALEAKKRRRKLQSKKGQNPFMSLK